MQENPEPARQDPDPDPANQAGAEPGSDTTGSNITNPSHGRGDMPEAPLPASNQVPGDPAGNSSTEPHPPAATDENAGGDPGETYMLVQRARAGDEQARDRLFGLYVERVRRVVRMRLGSRLRRRVEVNDLVQSVLLHAVRDFDQFEYRGEGAFFHWLNRIVENRVRDRLKHEMRAKRDIRRDQTVSRNLGSSSTLDPTAHLPTPSRIIQGREELDRIEAAIDALPQDMREVIILRKYENLAWKEIATEFEQSEGTVRRLFARALNRLAHTIKDLDES